MSTVDNTTCVFEPEQFKSLFVIGYIDFSLYILTLGFLLYNCWWLLIKKNRWHNKQILLAYSFSLLIIITRIVFLAEWRQIARDNRSGEIAPVSDLLTFNIAEETASSGKVWLGICQVIAMFEIS